MTDAIGQAALVRAGEVKPSELVEEAIGRIEQLNPTINAVILPAFERARAQAKKLDEIAARSREEMPPFFGVPFLMKDLGGLEAGAPAHLGSNFLKRAGWVEKADSYFAAKIRDAGFVCLGRTNTPELGILPTTEPEAYGATRNPWNLEHSSGGSSGGASAAVASGMVRIAHASDGGGSIRIPAAHCGLVGLKPTRGRNSFGPGAGERWSGFSCELVVAHSVRDVAAVLDVTNGPMPGDPYYAAPPSRPYLSVVGAPVRPLRIGLLAAAPRPGIELHPACAAAARAAAGALEFVGHVVEDSFPPEMGDVEATRSFVSIIACNIARSLDAMGEKVGKPVQESDVEPLTWALAEVGRQFGAPRLLAAIDAAHAVSRRMAAWWESGFDLLITPTTAQPAPKIGELVPDRNNVFEGYTRSAPYGAYTMIFNQTGQPAISLPLGMTENGLPVGAQLVSAYGREDLLLRVAAQLEAALPWRGRRASLAV